MLPERNGSEKPKAKYIITLRHPLEFNKIDVERGSVKERQDCNDILGIMASQKSNSL